jgi:hypothetical protein
MAWDMKWKERFLAVALVAAASYGAYWYYQGATWKHGYIKASDAFKRAFNDRDAELVVYDPEWRDYKIASDELSHIKAPNRVEQARAEMLQECAARLIDYRDGASTERRLTHVAPTNPLPVDYLEQYKQALEKLQSIPAACYGKLD